ncbi:MAG: FtsX-like permease family protein [Steroidobacteraceae bacterium]|nr:FtsX-like permease family protein [Steroidobacteraceae bacterium]
MKYLVLVWAGLWRKPARTVLTSMSVVSAFLLYGALSGTMVSFDRWLGQITGDVTVLWTASRVDRSAGLPIGILPAIERIPGVLAVDIQQGFNSYFQDPKNGVGVETIDVARRIKYPRPFFTVSDGALEAMRRVRTGAIVGAELMEKYGWKVGDRVPLTSGVIRKDRSNVWVFDIVGTFDVTGTQARADQMWVNYDYFDEARAFGKGTVGGVISVIADPSQATRIAAEIDRRFANSPNETLTRSLGDMIRAEIDQITDIKLIIDVVLSAVLFTLLFVTGNTMMQSTVDRIPEFAVLKTYGFSDALIAALVLVESAALCLISALIGIAVAATVLFPLIGAAFRIGTLPMDASVVVTGVGIAVALACVIALPPLWRLGRLNVVDALAGR